MQLFAAEPLHFAQQTSGGAWLDTSSAMHSKQALSRGRGLLLQGDQLDAERCSAPLEIKVGVEYGTDPRKVSDLLTGLARKHPDVLSEPPAKTIFVGFGESSLDFRLDSWTQSFDRWVDIQSELTIRVYLALTEASIGIPYSHRTVWLKAAPDSRCGRSSRAPGGSRPPSRSQY